MKYADDTSVFLHRLRALPLSWLSLALSKRLLILVLSYILGMVGLWVLFPLVHNGVTMFLPIICACWLFRYRRFLVSILLNGIIFQLTYLLLLRNLLPTQAFIEGGLIGVGTSLGLGLVVCWLRIAVDITQRARQQALVAERERLQALQVEQQAKLAYEQQRQINAMKDQFLLNVSHELRTPLTILSGTLEMLEEHFEYLDAERRIYLLQEARESKTELVELVNRILDATVVVSEIPQAQCEVVVLQPLVQEVLAHLASQDVQAYTIHLLISEHMSVWADPQFLRQILRNLLSNIFKYVPRQTEVRIEAVPAVSSASVALSVEDAGPGIPPEELPLLFEKFVRLKRDLAGNRRGTGLGLYICKSLVEAMGGRIWVESSGRLGEGSRFCITLPGSSP